MSKSCIRQLHPRDFSLIRKTGWNGHHDALRDILRQQNYCIQLLREHFFQTWSLLYFFFLEVFSIEAIGVLQFPFSSTHHNKQILGIAHSSHGDAAGTCQAYSREELPHCYSPCPRPATPQLDSIQGRRSVGSRTGLLVILPNKPRSEMATRNE